MLQSRSVLCVCVSLCPCPSLLAKQGATQQPVCDWAGLRGFLTQHGADCSGTCFNRWSRLESVITSGRGLEERGCLPGAVWSPSPPHSSALKARFRDTSPLLSMSKAAPGKPTRGENSLRNPSFGSHSASTWLSCLSGTIQLLLLFRHIFTKSLSLVGGQLDSEAVCKCGFKAGLFLQ